MMPSKGCSRLKVVPRSDEVAELNHFFARAVQHDFLDLLR